MNDIRVHAVDASNLVSKEGCEKLVEIYRSYSEHHQVFVLSPVRDSQLEIGSLLLLARHHDERLWSMLEKRFSVWTELVDRLLARLAGEKVLQRIKEGFANIEDLLRAVWLVEDISSGSKNYIDMVVSSWVADVLCHYVTALKITSNLLDYQFALRETGVKQDCLFVSGLLPQAENFSPSDGIAEYAASMLAASLQAKGLTFWNDMALLRNADVLEVPSAKIIRSLSYAEATELSFFGAPLIHPQALLPAIEASIDVQLRWWADIEAEGTVISKQGDGMSPNRVKGFSIIHDVALINVEGAGMSGVIGIASRLFTAMREASISVILISQASSEYSICFAVPEKQMRLAVETAKVAFAHELGDHMIQSIDGEIGCAILAAVGKQMTGQAGVAGKFFSSLGKAGVNVRAIAQGSSETNISVVIKGSDSKKALRALHAGFFLSKQALSVGLFGPGNIGGTLLDQIASETVRLKEQFGLDIHIRGIANSRKMLLDEEGIDLSRWKERFENEAVDLKMEDFINHIGATYFPHSLLVDCTTSSQLAEKYVSWLERGIHIITPNKKAGTTNYTYYRSLLDTCLRTGRRFLYETTVGAGLPVICTLKDLVQTGDRVHRIEGIVSGTLAWLFNQYDGNVPFSSLVRKAKEMGYTEPDPRDDLSGMDVGRKTVILARELGYAVEVSDIPIESLVPIQLQDASLSEFMSRLEELDEPMLKLFREAEGRGEKLRYVGCVDEQGHCSASLKSFVADHPFAQATGTDNVICYTTDRYFSQPLVIKGPGAGRDVTAGGVFSDILRLAAYLGARI
ncbi:homoserine dehydrogenase [Sphaerochaeta pleomorpha str. Grapes]|uniref:Homoserine dehydrogenase n=1 Tax=Sphaerochaeta pleomorpha (strain ATCC BAA-1885 / DSM 22778 / Grapes) TaxID=158190 RepID=G8QSZ6_SPHPG|nr:bifunctional aspartate kinase/homoserine dehydrogenase I [Sphaerochaeta pleomorpha]AEV27901.1 homoserine dehydrogenase [Sphaerochaeta pleomorpha str. Grapes]